MFKIYDPQTTAQTILQRRPPDEVTIPESLQARIAGLFGEPLSPDQAVHRILQDVRQRGDAALEEWACKLDGAAPAGFRVPEDQIQAALQAIPPEVRTALQQMAERIEAYHRRQPLTSWFTHDLGGVLGQVVRPIR